MNRSCLHEDAVVAAALAGDNGGMPPEILTHLASCEGCREVHGLVATLHDERSEALAQAQLPSAGLVWWKATLRARHEDAARATRPITVVAALTAACLVGLLASLVGLAAWWLQDSAVVRSLADAWSSATAGSGTVVSVTSATGTRLAVWLVAGALAIAMPVAVYVALREE